MSAEVLRTATWFDEMLAPDVVESAEKRVGETIGGKWHLDRVIGVGGMAAVYEATHRNRNRVAIKLLHPALSLEEGTRHRFLREGYVANTIRHDGAVQVLDDDVTDDGYAFLVMELLRGESVEERMVRKGGTLDVQEALNITAQLLEVLEAAHDQHVVHRDIKPDNLFLTEEGKLKVLDFGIARLNQGGTRTTKVGSFMGTPAFCAQEQARGRWDEVDHRTDLYSVGASLFTCLTGTHVHEAETSSEQLALAIGATARSLRDVMPHAPSELVDLVDTSLKYDKEDRFQSARAMRAAVRRVIAGLPVDRKATTPPPPSGARTFGPNELDPDSMPPPMSTILEKPAFGRVAVGIIVALALAVLIFVISKPAPQTSETAQATATAEEEKPPSTGAQPQDVLAAQAAETGTAPPSQVAPAAEAAPAAVDEKAPASKPKEPVAGPKPQASVKKPVTRVRPVAAPAPAPKPAPSQGTASYPAPSSKDSGSGDEDMFDKQF